jgi:hypothetical protein
MRQKSIGLKIEVRDEKDEREIKTIEKAAGYRSAT